MISSTKIYRLTLIRITVLVSLIIFLFGCEYGYDYSYLVINRAGSDIRIHFSTFREDSVMMIPADSSRVIILFSHGIEGPKGPYIADKKVDLDTFEVTIGDSLHTNKNYLDNHSWRFDSGNGRYSAIVTMEEFE
jgi:hypothetical protein